VLRRGGATARSGKAGKGCRRENGPPATGAGRIAGRPGRRLGGFVERRGGVRLRVARSGPVP